MFIQLREVDERSFPLSYVKNIIVLKIRFILKTEVISFESFNGYAGDQRLTACDAVGEDDDPPINSYTAFFIRLLMIPKKTKYL